MILFYVLSTEYSQIKYGNNTGSQLNTSASNDVRGALFGGGRSMSQATTHIPAGNSYANHTSIWSVSNLPAAYASLGIGNGGRSLYIDPLAVTAPRRSSSTLDGSGLYQRGGALERDMTNLTRGSRVREISSCYRRGLDEVSLQPHSHIPSHTPTRRYESDNRERSISHVPVYQSSAVQTIPSGRISPPREDERVRKLQSELEHLRAQNARQQKNYALENDSLRAEHLARSEALQNERRELQKEVERYRAATQRLDNAVKKKDETRAQFLQRIKVLEAQYQTMLNTSVNPKDVDV